MGSDVKYPREMTSKALLENFSFRNTVHDIFVTLIQAKILNIPLSFFQNEHLRIIYPREMTSKFSKAISRSCL